MNTSNYEVIRQIGGGQEGRIFLARQAGHLYALKELIATPAQTELQVLSAIKHPAVIALHETILTHPVTLVL